MMASKEKCKTKEGKDEDSELETVPRRSTRLSSHEFPIVETSKESDGEPTKHQNRTIASYFKCSDSQSLSSSSSEDSGAVSSYEHTSASDEESMTSDEVYSLEGNGRDTQRIRDNIRPVRKNGTIGATPMDIDSEDKVPVMDIDMGKDKGHRYRRKTTDGHIPSIRIRSTVEGLEKQLPHIYTGGGVTSTNGPVQSSLSVDVDKDNSTNVTTVPVRTSRRVAAAAVVSDNQIAATMVSNHINAVRRENKKKRKERNQSEYRLTGNSMTFEEMALKHKRHLAEFKTLFGKAERRTQGLISNIFATLLEYQEDQLQCMKLKEQYDDPIVTGALNLLGMSHLGNTCNMTDKDIMFKVIYGSHISDNVIDTETVGMPKGTVGGNVIAGADNIYHGDERPRSDDGDDDGDQEMPETTSVRINTPVHRSVMKRRRRRSTSDSARGISTSGSGSTRGDLAMSGKDIASQAHLRESVGGINRSDEVHALTFEERMNALPSAVIESYLKDTTIERDDRTNVALRIRFREMTPKCRAENLKRWKTMMIEMSDMEVSVSLQFNDAFEQLRGQLDDIKAQSKNISELQATNERLLNKFIKDRAAMGTDSQTFFMYNTSITTGSKLYTSPFDQNTLNQMYEDQHTENVLG